MPQDLAVGEANDANSIMHAIPIDKEEAALACGIQVDSLLDEVVYLADVPLRITFYVLRGYFF